MANGQTVILAGPSQRALAVKLVMQAPDRAVMNIQEEHRSLDQNALFWALLSDVSRSKPQGRKLPTEKWKCLFMDAVGIKAEWEPGLDGGVVNVGYKSSRLTKAQFSDLVTFIQAWGSENGVRWSDLPTQEAA